MGGLASIAFVDRCVGHLIDALDESPHAGNTIVVLASDHGFHLGEKERWRKFTLWDEATRVPLVVVAPGVGAPDVRLLPNGATFTYRRFSRSMGVLIRERDFPSGSAFWLGDPSELQMIEIQIGSLDLDTFPVDQVASELLARNLEHQAGAWVVDRGQNRLALAEKVRPGELDTASLQWICDRMVATVAELEDLVRPDSEAR